MKTLAHMGIEHGSGQEAAIHQSSSTVLVIAVVTAVIILLMASAVYLVRRFGAQESANNVDREE